MAAPLRLREDFGGPRLRFLVKRGRDGACRKPSRRRTISRSCPCRRIRPNTTRSRISVSSFASIGSRTGSTRPIRISSAIAVAPGTASSSGPEPSGRSDCEIGRIDDRRRRLLSAGPQNRGTLALASRNTSTWRGVMYQRRRVIKPPISPFFNHSKTSVSLTCNARATCADVRYFAVLHLRLD